MPGGDADWPAEKERRREQFLAIVSHEMRTPLTSIISFSELIRGEADGLTPEGLHFLDIIERNADRLLKLVSDLLMLDRIEAGALPLDPAPVDIPALAAETVVAAESMAAKQDIVVRLVAPRAGPLFRGDWRRLQQILDNLISNAIKFSHPGGVVTVTATWTHAADEAPPAAAGGMWRVDVVDTGIGISPDDMDALFGRFARGTNARATGVPGSGLGLSIVKVLTEMHGGHVEVTSDLGEGTTFSVFLPVPGDDGDAGDGTPGVHGTSPAGA